MNQTQNYQLSQWESTDRILMSDFNSDNAKLDAALKSHDAALAALEAGLTGKGNCQLWTTTYTGNGRYGTSSRRSVTFPKQPLFVIITAAAGQIAFWGFGQPMMTCIMTLNDPCSWLNAAWSGTTLSWYSDDSAFEQLNQSATTYTVLALLQNGD